MKSSIAVLMDSNEQGSERAKALALACGGDPTYDLRGFADLPVDMCCSLIDEAAPLQYKTMLVELKEIPDFWQSKSSGHLGAQILEIVTSGDPGFVAVFGSLQEVLTGVPKVKASGPRKQIDVQQDLSTARAFCADAAACGVPVHFLSRNHRQSFAWILSYAKNILTGPNMASWLPKFAVEPRGYACLCAIPGIGDVAARGLLEAYGSIAQISSEARLNPKGLAKCQINGKALGKAKTARIVEVLG